MNDRIEEIMAQAETLSPEPMCDHRCLLPDGHDNEYGHQYGYNLPSDQDRIADLLAEVLELRKENSALRKEIYILTERIGALRHKISDFRNLNLQSVRKIVKLEDIIRHLEIVIDEIHGEAV